MTVTSPTATAEIERLARMHAEASPGPWWAYEDREAGPGWDWVVRMKKDPKSAQAEISDLSPPNAAFLVAAYNDLPALLAALRAAEAERDRMRYALVPFAAVAEHDIGESEHDSDLFWPINKHNRALPLTIGDLRRARDALQSTSAKEGE